MARLHLVETAIPFLHRAGMTLALDPTTATVPRSDGPESTVPGLALAAALVDCATGLDLLEEHRFGYTATTELQVHLTGAPASGPLLRACSTPRRIRRRSAVLGSEVVDGQGTVVAVGRAAFEHLGEAAADRAQTTLATGIAAPPSPGGPIEIGAAVASRWDGHVLTAAIEPDLANPAGNLSGPAIVVVAERAAVLAAGPLVLDPVAISLGVSFLAAARGTEISAAPTIVGRVGTVVLVDVHLVAGDRPVAWAQAQIVPRTEVTQPSGW